MSLPSFLLPRFALSPPFSKATRPERVEGGGREGFLFPHPSTIPVLFILSPLPRRLVRRSECSYEGGSLGEGGSLLAATFLPCFSPVSSLF